MLEGFQCNREVKLMTDWIQEKTPECRPCLLSPLAGFYLGVLEQAGESKLAETLKQVHETAPDPLTICQEFDRLKGEVGDALRKELVELDCFTQSYTPQDA